MSSSKSNTDANKRDLNNNNNESTFNPFMVGAGLWQSAAMSWFATYNEFLKNASRMTEYWFKLFWNPWNISEEEKKDKVKVE